MRNWNLKGSRCLAALIIEVPRTFLELRQQQVTVQVAEIFLELFIKHFESMSDEFDIMLLHDWIPFRCQLVLLCDSDFVKCLWLVVYYFKTGIQEMTTCREVNELERAHVCIFN